MPEPPPENPVADTEDAAVGTFSDDEQGSVAHVYTVEPIAERDGRTDELIAGFLDAGERERFERFIPEHSRLEFLTGRVLLRSVLAKCLGVKPAEVGFEIDENGKPHLANNIGHDLQFNLSHTRGLVACAVCRAHPIGVDVEIIEPARATAGIAERFFSRAETAELATLKGNDRVGRFFKIWTLKEAYIKAHGRGMRVGLGNFSVELAERSVGISFADRIDDDPAAWQFISANPTARHFLAVAIRHGAAAAPLDIRVTQWAGLSHL